jgi:hypothetical protein
VVYIPIRQKINVGSRRTPVQRHQATILSTRFLYRNVGRNGFGVERRAEIWLRVYAAFAILPRLRRRACGTPQFIDDGTHISVARLHSKPAERPRRNQNRPVRH